MCDEPTPNDLTPGGFHEIEAGRRQARSSRARRAASRVQAFGVQKDDPTVRCPLDPPPRSRYTSSGPLTMTSVAATAILFSSERPLASSHVVSPASL